MSRKTLRARIIEPVIALKAYKFSNVCENDNEVNKSGRRDQKS